MKLMIIVWSCVAGLSAFATQAAETAYTVRATDVKAKPFADAATLASLPERSKVEVLGRKASWMQIKVDDASGWVKMLSLRFSDEGAPGKTGDGGLGALFNVASTGKSGSTVTTGVRGLSEENLKTAQPNPQALKTIRGYAANAENATSFARAGKLEKNNMDYLPPARKGE
jgi:hypothetical protein